MSAAAAPLLLCALVAVAVALLAAATFRLERTGGGGGASSLGRRTAKTAPAHPPAPPESVPRGLFGVPWPPGPVFERASSNEHRGTSDGPGQTRAFAAGYPYNFELDDADPAAVALNRFYSSAEVDPLVTGQLYAGTRAAGEGRRLLYGGRTSHGDKWGLHEFSTGVPGQAGVDVGPLGLREYSLDGLPGVFDDGIPENWRLPSTPPSWYAPRGRDYYDVENQDARPYEPNLVSLREPDHDPLVN